MNFRPVRVSNLIHEELGRILVRELEFPGVLVTITDVDVTKKLDLARVRIAVWPSERSKEVLHGLQEARPVLQRLMMKKINIRPTPHLEFEIDHGNEKAAQIEKVALEIEQKGDLSQASSEEVAD